MTTLSCPARAGWLTLREAAERLGRSGEAVKRRARRGLIRTYNEPGGRVLYASTDVDAILPPPLDAKNENGQASPEEA